MIGGKNARLAALACAVIVLSTLAVLLARRMNLGPARPAPEFRAFGPENAALQIYEYTDLACPACGHASLALEEMLRIYAGSIRLHFKHYPLENMHPWSRQAAAYADCAGEQGKFKEYAALLFESQEKWAQAKSKPGEFELSARKLNLDWPKMEACSAAPETARRVALDIAEAETKGVNATPTFFINGKRAVGGGQLLEQARKFDSLLKKKP